ncbi:MAG: hypothetical protein HFP77_01875 [Methylococcales symbiont of Iophon sp. n. MRB-2018]|nr:MAG: hypothetical protein HFP77_01875 [Methylococcales symbiont of Iophon sp. n. MRB-2018]KAF3980543.1 MAG: hypothetical protein HFP76_01590 [Methylococcales symbiont of Iophon sp. n. MRB-2018]
MRGTHPMDLHFHHPWRANAPYGLESLLALVIPEVCYRESSFKHLDFCLEHAGITEGVKRILYPIQQITLNERALVALCLGLILLVCFYQKNDQ